MLTAEILQRRIDTAGAMQSLVKTMKALAAVNINQFEQAVRSLADYDRTVQLGLQALLRKYEFYGGLVRGEKYKGYMILVYDERGELIAKSLSHDWLLDIVDRLRALLRRAIRDWFVEGSDPGLCLTERVPPAVIEFGRRCQRDVVAQREARDLAARHAICLEGLGGTEDGVIGALAAVGLVAGGNDPIVIDMPKGRYVPRFHRRKSGEGTSRLPSGTSDRP